MRLSVKIKLKVFSVGVYLVISLMYWKTRCLGVTAMFDATLVNLKKIIELFALEVWELKTLFRYCVPFI